VVRELWPRPRTTDHGPRTTDHGPLQYFHARPAAISEIARLSLLRGFSAMRFPGRRHGDAVRAGDPAGSLSRRIRRRLERRGSGSGKRLAASKILALLQPHAAGPRTTDHGARTTTILRASANPFHLLLASNYLPPYYTHPLNIDGERYADGGFVNNIPYETLFERGCDVVLTMACKGESEGGLQRRFGARAHAIPPEVIVIRPRDRDRLAPIADLGAAPHPALRATLSPLTRGEGTLARSGG
jgi:patatin-like phospholipase